MIIPDFQPYCSGCPKIEPIASVSYLEVTTPKDTRIYCKHRKECERLIDFLYSWQQRNSMDICKEEPNGSDKAGA